MELVVYKIKPDQIENYRNSALHQFRELVRSFSGMLHYHTYGALGDSGLFVDQVQWENQESAEFAAEKIRSLQHEEPFASIFSTFEEIQLCHHFRQIP